MLPVPLSIKIVLTVVAVTFIAALLALVLTFLLLPLWSWIESTYSIESVGHSGPAGWCFGAVWGILVLASLPWVHGSWRRRTDKNRS